MNSKKISRIKPAETLFPRRKDGLERPVHIADSIKGVMRKIQKHLDRKKPMVVMLRLTKGTSLE